MFIATIVLALLVGVPFLALGLGKVLEREPMVEARTHLKMPRPLWRIVGLLEILGGIGVLAGLAEPLPPIGVLSTAGLTALTVGAGFYHQRAGDPMKAWLPAVAMGSLAIFYGILRVATA